MGLANVTDKNRPGLERICQKLGVSKIELLWATKLKPGCQSLINAEAGAESSIYQLRQLLWSVHCDTPAVKKSAPQLRVDVPEHLFDEELLIDNGTSALHQLNRMTAPRLRDALYLRLR